MRGEEEISHVQQPGSEWGWFSFWEQRKLGRTSAVERTGRETGKAGDLWG